ncbi:MAG: HD domain-containing protein [Fimbriimonadaceae bacterium]|nr:HD domain-containing protein [Fimbriimonadaceae bacterium]
MLFTAVGALCVYLIYQSSLETYHEQNRAQLRSLAEVIALQVNPDAIKSLEEPTQTDTEAFIEETKKLEAISSSASDIDHVAVLKQIGPQYHFVVDASLGGQEKSKSKLLDPADDIPNELVESLTNRVGVASQEPFEDRWGTWYSAFAPVINSAGNVVGVVEVDRDIKKIQFGDQRILNSLRLTGLLVLILGLATAWIAAGPVSRGFEENLFRATSSKLRLATEIALGVLVLFVIFEVVMSLSQVQKISELTSKSQSQENALTLAMEARNEATLRGKVTQELHESLNSALRLVSIDWTDDSEANDLKPNSANLKKLDEIIGRLKSSTVAQQTLLKNAEKSQQKSILRLMIGIALLGIAVFTIVRYSANLDESVARARSESSSFQAQLTSLIENLPVGMFILENGDITFANSEWLEQVRSPGQAHLSDLRAAIHEDDQEKTIHELMAAAQEARSFRILYRLNFDGSQTQHMETRGVPVYDMDGICRRMLGFSIDMTPTVEAGQAVQNAYREVEHKNKLLANALAELEENLESVVRALVKAVEAKDPYTAGHSERVMQYSLMLGDAIGLGPYEKRILELGTLVHDVGKIGIPDAILTKPDKLTEEEYAIIKKHPEFGVAIIENIAMFQECLPIVRWHHERLDGKGYPDGLQGDELSVLVRISAIADIFDAMTSTRAYRKGMEIDKVLDVMHGLAEKGEIDYQLFSTFCHVIRENGLIAQDALKTDSNAA